VELISVHIMKPLAVGHTFSNAFRTTVTKN